MRFLPWHLGFFCRYRPFPEAEFGEPSRRHPLLQTRPADRDDVSPLEALLRDARPAVHEALARELLSSVSAEDARERALRLQAISPREAAPDGREQEIAEVAG